VALVERLQGKRPLLVTVATETGKAFLPDCPVYVGRMNPGEMVEFIKSHAIDQIVDVSHPYATEVSKNARQAQQQTAIEYIRFTRPKSDSENVIACHSLEECLRLLQTISGCVFFTTGSNHVKEFQAIRGNNRFVYRVLPTPESLQECRTHKVALKDIIAALGPFSMAMNSAMFREYRADYVVMKNSGQKGGTSEKIAACRQLGIKPVVIERGTETGFTDLDELVAFVLRS
jgi:precorrin-6A/cobalt-precorrin-6A reductase